jgi:hypothetical protein
MICGRISPPLASLRKSSDPSIAKPAARAASRSLNMPIARSRKPPFSSSTASCSWAVRWLSAKPALARIEDQVDRHDLPGATAGLVRADSPDPAAAPRVPAGATVALVPADSADPADPALAVVADLADLVRADLAPDRAHPGRVAAVPPGASGILAHRRRRKARRAGQFPAEGARSQGTHSNEIHRPMCDLTWGHLKTAQTGAGFHEARGVRQLRTTRP